MKQTRLENGAEKRISLKEHLGCFGEFRPRNPVCRRLCALRLRCAIEREQADQMELFEELFDPEILTTKPQ